MSRTEKLKANYPNYMEITRKLNMSLLYIRRQPMDIHSRDTELCKLEKICNSTGLKVVESNGYPIRVKLLGLKPEVEDQETRVSGFFDEVLESDDVILYPTTMRGEISPEDYHKLKGLSTKNKSLHDVLVISNNLAELGRKDLGLALHEFNQLMAQDPDKRNYKQIESVSIRILRYTRIKERNFLFSPDNIGIVDCLGDENKTHSVYQVMDVKNIVSRTIQDELDKRKIGYVVIVPWCDKKD